jgi:septal ring factor EnvC (AmiA/AmiB activator)
MLIEDIRGVIGDALDRGGLSANRTVDLIKGRAIGAPSDRMFAAAVTVLREQAKCIAELDAEIDELTNDNGHLQDELNDLEAELEALREGKE